MMTERRMRNRITTLLIRNLDEVFGGGDPVRRRSAVEEIFTQDAIFREPAGLHRGWDEIDHIAGVIRATHPAFRYRPLRDPEDLQGEVGRIDWVLGRPGGAPEYAGTDIAVLRDGRIAELYLFFNDAPTQPV